MDENPQPLTSDPVYYGTVAFFALLTTALPAILGQPRFLPTVQAIALTVFAAIPTRAGLVNRTVKIVCLWLGVQLVSMALMSALMPAVVEQSIPGGFELRTGLAAWIYGAGSLPGSLLAAPVSHLIEAAGILLGSLATAGLAGYWFLMRAVNATGFSMGVLFKALEGPLRLPLSVPAWSLLRIAGMAGLVILLSEPLLRGQWSPGHVWHKRRRLLVVSVVLLVSGYLLASACPPLWQSLFSAIMR